MIVDKFGEYYRVIIFCLLLLDTSRSLEISNLCCLLHKMFAEKNLQKGRRRSLLVSQKTVIGCYSNPSS